VPDETIGSDNITQYLPPNNLTIQTSSGPMPAELGPVYAKWTRDPSDNDTSLVDPNVLDGPKGQILDINDYLKPGGGGGGGGGGDGGAGFPNVSASAFVADQSSLDFRKNGFQVSDTAQNVSGVIDALNNDSSAIAITLTDGGVPTLSLKALQAVDTAALSKITNSHYAVAISDTAANVSANLDALNADRNLDAITLTDGGVPSLNLSAAQALVDTTALSKIANINFSIAISDTAADVSAAIDALETNSSVSSITLIDGGTPTLDLHVSQALNDTSALVKISNVAYAVQIDDTASSVLGDAAALSADAKIAGITVIDTATNIITNATALAANSQVTSLVVEDTIANITANAAMLSANPQIKSIIAIDTAANVLADATSLQVDAIVVSDTAANVSSNIDALNGDAGVDAIELTDSGKPTDADCQPGFG